MRARQQNNNALRSVSDGPPRQRAESESPTLTFEQRLNSDPRWALGEGSRFFEGKGSVHDALRKVTARLDELKIPYAVIGGLALFHHGYRRFTEDVDLLVTREGLQLIHQNLEGLGYLPPFTRSKNLRDVETGVKIEFLVAGDFPGDGKAKPVAFPDPLSVRDEGEGIGYINLGALVEIKLASGMTSPARLKDLADVVELIKALNLPLAYADNLHPYVQEKFRELWRSARRRYVLLWRNKFLTANAGTLDDMIEQLGVAAGQLKAMKADGVFLDPEGGMAGDYAYLVTFDPSVAKKYGMEEESEIWDDDPGDNSSGAGGA